MYRGVLPTWLVSGLLVMGCVNLDKPESVKRNCSGGSTSCIDNFMPNPGSDAGRVDGDGKSSGDLSVGDEPVVVHGDDAHLGNFDYRDDVPDVPVDGADSTVVEDGPNGADTCIDSDVARDSLARSGEVDSELPPDHVNDPEPGSEPGPEPGFDAGAEIHLDVGRDSGPDRGRADSSAGTCINQLISNGYAAGSAPTCRQCMENGISLEAKCQAMIDCLAPPCTKACTTYCQNSAQADGVVSSCVSALTQAACPSGF
jgi:hypothetical protein